MIDTVGSFHRGIDFEAVLKGKMVRLFTFFRAAKEAGLFPTNVLGLPLLLSLFL